MVQNITQYCHVCKSQTTSGPPVVLAVSLVSLVSVVSFRPFRVLVHAQDDVRDRETFYQEIQLNKMYCTWHSKRNSSLTLAIAFSATLPLG